ADAERSCVDAADDSPAGVVDAEDLLGVPPGLAHREVLGIDVDHVDDRVEAVITVVALVADPGVLTLVAGCDDTGLDDLPQTAGVGDACLPTARAGRHVGLGVFGADIAARGAEAPVAPVLVPAGDDVDTGDAVL